jgi:hypothetical protein
MNLKELDSFKISDAVTFHDRLNPALWAGTKLRPEVKNQLEEIAKDFLEEMGIHDLDVRDITISGSNAAFSYTPNSDLDLHILVNIADLPNNEIYKELFHAKKSLYNDNHDITIHGVPVELYVQDAAQPSASLGEYSLQNDKWTRVPTKRRANFDESATKAKYEKLANIIELALQSEDVHKVDKVLKKLKQYRQAGLDKGGEFGPENLSFKAVRSQGLITQLYALRDKLHSQRLSIEGMYSIDEEKDKLNKHTPTIEQLLIKYKVPKRDILIQLDKGIKVELEHTSDRKVAREIALDHLGEDPHYYNKLAKAELEESLDKPYKILRWEKGDFGDVDAIARLDDNTFLSIMFSKVNSARTGQEAWSVEFYRNNSQEVTGEGDAQRVFATVLGAIQTFIKKYKPNMVIFSATKEVEDGKKSQSRARLYDSLIQRYANSWGYRARRTESGSVVQYELSRINKVEEASGYIPSNAQKNDPRFKTALTVDVKPDSIKKNAKAFSWLTSRAGIPPTAKPSGKI